MKKTFKRYIAFAAAMGFGVCLFGFSDVRAAQNDPIDNNEALETVADEPEIVSEVLYNDANVSISSALDRYIAFNSTSALDEILGVKVVEEEKDVEEKEDQNTKATNVASSSYIDFSNKAIVTTSGQVNIRKDADVNSGKVGIINNGGLVTVIDKGSEWSHIKSGNCEGYIKNEFLAFGNDAKNYAEKNLQMVAVVNATTLRLRESDSEESECLTLLTGGEEYGIVNQGDAWTKVEVDAGLSGYVKNEYISISYRTSRAVAVNTSETSSETANSDTASGATTQAANNNDNQTTAAQATTAAPSSDATTSAPVSNAPAVNPNAQEVCNYALQFVGNPYVYGGSSLTNGTDCSGFTMSVYANFGVYLPHSSSAQANCGTEVSLSEVAPGDIIFYKNGGTTIGHAALYIGNGQVVHASTEKTGIIVSNMYYSTPCKAIRVY
ncbi:MAG: C40 family peptidase [Lachnospiraceae bacterium]|nr:C40 family peptidase [Lachnospiraceae bacterium]